MGCSCISKNFEEEMDTQHEKLQIFEEKERNKEKECLLLKTKSKYILNNIKNYIDNLNILKFVAH